MYCVYGAVFMCARWWVVWEDYSLLTVATSSSPECTVGTVCGRQTSGGHQLRLLYLQRELRMIMGIWIFLSDARLKTKHLYCHCHDVMVSTIYNSGPCFACLYSVTLWLCRLQAPCCFEWPLWINNCDSKTQDILVCDVFMDVGAVSLCGQSLRVRKVSPQ